MKILVDHGNRSHILDLTKVKIGDLKDTPNKVLGDAYRAASHEKNKHLFGNPFQNEKDFLLFCVKKRKQRQGRRTPFIIMGL